MIANDFPPIGGAGVQRSLYFARYLGNFGWLPVVLTVKEVAFPAKDPTLLTGLPAEVEVIRTETFEFRRLAWHFQRLRNLGRRSAPNPAPSAAMPGPIGARSRELFRAIRRWLLVPDDRLLWAPFALVRALAIVRSPGIEAIFATTPCYSSGVIGLLLSRITGLPLVLDLRDPWTRDPYLPSPTPLHAWLNSKLEGAALGRASKVIVISNQMREVFRGAYPGLPADRFVTITNGFDADELAAAEPVETGGKFVIVYLGSLYAHHRSVFGAFCAAWSSLVRRVPDFGKTAELWLAGRCDPEILWELDKWPAVSASRLGYQPHSEALRRLRSASVLLLLIKDLDPSREVVTIPGKLFEYVATGLPIVMIGPEGDAAELVRGSGGSVHRESEAEGIAHSILERFLDHRDGRSRPASSAVRSRYERRNLTGLLASQLDSVVSESNLDAEDT